MHAVRQTKPGHSAAVTMVLLWRQPRDITAWVRLKADAGLKRTDRHQDPPASFPANPVAGAG